MGANRKTTLFAPAGQDGFLDQQLQAIRDRLQKPEGPNDVRAFSKLHRGNDLALRVGEIGDRHQQRDDDGDDLGDDDRARPEIVAPQFNHRCRFFL